VFSEALSENAVERDKVSRLMDAEDQVAAKSDTRGMSWTILRATMHYGYGLDHDVSQIARLIRQFGLFFVYPPASGRRQPVHVDDLAQAAVSILEKPVTYGKIYNLGGGEIVTYREMVERIFGVCRSKVRVFNCRFLPFMLDAASVLLQKKSLSGEIARRMNEDVVFFHDEPQRDFEYAPRPFLSGGVRDLGGF